MTDVLDTLGARVRRLRLAAGLSQEKLAERLDMDVGAVSQIERGRREPSMGTLRALCQVLRCSADEIVFGNQVKCAEASG